MNTSAAKEITEEHVMTVLRAIPQHQQQAYRYLFARVAIDNGLAALVRREAHFGGDRLVGREVATNIEFSVERPPEWSVEQEEQHVVDMKRRMQA